MQFRNKIILIIGGATGIGYGFAQNLSEQGNLVIITGRREEKLRELKRNSLYSCAILNHEKPIH